MINHLSDSDYKEIKAGLEKTAAEKATARMLRKAAKKAAKTERVKKAKAKDGGRRTRKHRKSGRR